LAKKTIQAKRYSQAVFEIASERNELDRWQADLQRMAVLAQDNEFVSIMENPKFPFEKKSRLLESQLNGINPLAFNLAHLLISRGEFSIITDIANEYRRLLDDFRGIEEAQVITAVPLGETEKTKLANFLGSLSGKKIEMTQKVDPRIIGGIIAMVGGKIIDGSTSSQLMALKSEIAIAGR